MLIYFFYIKLCCYAVLAVREKLVPPFKLNYLWHLHLSSSPLLEFKCHKLLDHFVVFNAHFLFCRIGAIAFGLGTLIYTGLEFLSFFEMPRTCTKWNILMGVNPVLYMIFVFMQMYYIFNHARLNVNKNKVKIPFGAKYEIPW